MSVVTVRAGIIAADRQMTNSGMKVPCEKVFLDYGRVFAFTGHADMEGVLKSWYLDGRKPEAWPKERQSGDDWTRMVVGEHDGSILVFERTPHPFMPFDAPDCRYMAFGGGAEYAFGAMAAGADAIRAVEATNAHYWGCGFGVTWFKFLPPLMEGALGRWAAATELREVV